MERNYPCLIKVGSGIPQNEACVIPLLEIVKCLLFQRRNQLTELPSITLEAFSLIPVNIPVEDDIF